MIVRNEVLPALAREPGYLQRNDMEMVRSGGDDAQAVAANTENLAVLRQGGLRLRPRPGPTNSLGLVKFIFPNDANVYLHDTPAPQLFGRARRDFSHGCVRVEDPVALARACTQPWATVSADAPSAVTKRWREVHDGGAWWLEADAHHTGCGGTTATQAQQARLRIVSFLQNLVVPLAVGGGELFARKAAARARHST